MRTAGCVFVGQSRATALSDYVARLADHVLPDQRGGSGHAATTVPVPSAGGSPTSSSTTAAARSWRRTSTALASTRASRYGESGDDFEAMSEEDRRTENSKTAETQIKLSI